VAAQYCYARRDSRIDINALVDAHESGLNDLSVGDQGRAAVSLGRALVMSARRIKLRSKSLGMVTPAGMCRSGAYSGSRWATGAINKEPRIRRFGGR
jgi:hypothetical protein